MQRKKKEKEDEMNVNSTMKKDEVMIEYIRRERLSNCPSAVDKIHTWLVCHQSH